jgi:hypothetical protein
MRARAAVLLVALLMSSQGTRGHVAALNNFSDAELDELFSPIALYPDPLLAQVVPAATFIDQLEQALRVLNGSSDDNLISPVPFHGYYFKILKAQGQSAPGGRYNYTINGRMLAGFALVAYPAVYGSS